MANSSEQTMQRRTLVTAAAAALAAPTLAWSQGLEKPKLTVAVGGKNLLYYLPLTIAESLGYFKAEGLEVTIADFAGGSRALQAGVGRNARRGAGGVGHPRHQQAAGARPGPLELH